MSLISPFAAYPAGWECLWHSLIGTCPSLQTCRGDSHSDAGHQHPEKDEGLGPTQKDNISKHLTVGYEAQGKGYQGWDQRATEAQVSPVQNAD